MKTINFYESQKIKPFWITIILILFLAFWLINVILQIFFNIPLGNHPVSDTVLVIIGIIPLGFIFLLVFSKLQTNVRSDGVYFKYFPFHFKQKKIGKNEIKSYSITRYHPIKEYGGWGIRYTLGKKKGRAYNVRGNIGMRFELKNGKNILLGTEKPEAFQKAMDDMNHPDNE